MTRILACLAALLCAPVAGAENAAPDCDRECLYGFVDDYLSALIARDPTRLRVAENVKFTENDVILALGEGAWKSARGIGSYQIYTADPKTGEAGFIGVLETDDFHSFYSLRIRVVARRVAEVETLLPGLTVGGMLDGALREAPRKMLVARAGFRAPLATAERTSREDMRAAADSYYEGIEAGSGEVARFGDGCHRVENGIALVNNPDIDFPPMIAKNGGDLPPFAAMNCRDQFNTNVWSTDLIGDRRYPLIDEEQGIVWAATMYRRFAKGSCVEIRGHGEACAPEGQGNPATLALVEAFKIRGGRIHEMESVWTVLPDTRARDHWP